MGIDLWRAGAGRQAMRYELNESVRLVHAERTGTVIALEPPVNYIVQTDDGHIWTVGEDELAPLKGLVGKGRRRVSPPVPPSDRGPHGAVALTAEQSAVWGYERPAGAHYRPSSSKGHRGAGWALGFMPLAMLAAQYAITIVLAKQLGAAQTHAGSSPSPFVGIASGGGFALLGLAFTVIGPLIVYSGTQNASLTVGFFVVRWIEGYLVSFVLTGAVLASLGLHVGPTVAAAPARVSGPQYCRLPAKPAGQGGDAIRCHCEAIRCH